MKSVGQSKKKLCCGTNMFPNAKIPKWQNQCCFGFRRKTQGWFDQGPYTTTKISIYDKCACYMMFLVARQGPTVGKCPLKS